MVDTFNHSRQKHIQEIIMLTPLSKADWIQKESFYGPLRTNSGSKSPAMNIGSELRSHRSSSWHPSYTPSSDVQQYHCQIKEKTINSKSLRKGRAPLTKDKSLMELVKAFFGKKCTATRDHSHLLLLLSEERAALIVDYESTKIGLIRHVLKRCRKSCAYARSCWPSEHLQENRWMADRIPAVISLSSVARVLMYGRSSPRMLISKTQLSGTSTPPDLCR